MVNKEKDQEFWLLMHEAFSPWPQAYLFLVQITSVLHAWDDLIDRDHPVSDEVIHETFWNALIEIPRNTFYQQNFTELSPLLRQAIVNWYVATEVERGESGQEREYAFVLRSSYVDLVAASLVICHGMQKALPMVRRLRQHVHAEGFSGYLVNLKTEKDIRDGMLQQ